MLANKVRTAGLHWRTLLITGREGKTRGTRRWSSRKTVCEGGLQKMVIGSTPWLCRFDLFARLTLHPLSHILQNQLVLGPSRIGAVVGASAHLKPATLEGSRSDKDDPEGNVHALPEVGCRRVVPEEIQKRRVKAHHFDHDMGKIQHYTALIPACFSLWS